MRPGYVRLRFPTIGARIITEIPATRQQDRRLLRAGLGVAVIRAFGLFSAFLSSVVLARALGPEGFGVYSYIFALIMLFGVPVQMGMPPLTMRETARANTVEAWARVRGIWWWAGTRIAALSALIVVGGLGLLAWQGPDLSANTWTAAALGLGLVPLIALGRLRGAALRGLGHVVAGQLPEGVLRPAFLMGGILVGGALLGVQFTPAGAMGVHLAAAALSFAVGAWLLWQKQPEGVRQPGPRETEGPAWFRALWPFTLLAGMQAINTQTDIVMLGFWVPAAEIGFYKIAASAAVLSAFGLKVLAMTLGPQIVRHLKQEEHRALARLAAWAAGIALATTTVAFAVLAVAGEWLLGLVYGPAFTAAYLPLMILVGAQLVNAAFGLAVTLLNMAGEERASLRGLIVSALANVVLNAILIPTLGTVGAAIATGLSLVLMNILVWRLVRVHLGFDCSVLALVRRNGSA